MGLAVSVSLLNGALLNFKLLINGSGSVNQTLIIFSIFLMTFYYWKFYPWLIVKNQDIELNVQAVPDLIKKYRWSQEPWVSCV